MFDGEGLGALASAIDALAAVDVRALPDAAVGEQIVALQCQAARLAAQLARRVEVFDRRGAAAADGAVSSGGWLRSTCRMGPGEARQLVVTARRLADALPATTAALAEGAISYRHACVLARASTDVPTELVAAAEETLVDSARRFSPEDLRRVTVHWRHVIDADEARAAAHAMHQRRYLSLATTFGGMVSIDGMLDPAAGAAVLAAVDALAAPQPDDVRSAGQRRADALAELATRSLAGGLPERGGERPHVLVTVDLSTLEARAGARAAELHRVGPVSGDTARRLACDASITRVLTDGPSEILDVGRRTRVVSPALRRALVVRDRGCVFPGCDRPPEWCDAHHLTFWADGGPTTLANLALVCAHHHQLLHEGNWRLRRDDAGLVHARRPDGTVLSRQPDGTVIRQEGGAWGGAPPGRTAA